MIFWLGLGNPRHIATKSQHLWAVPRQIKFWSILIKSWDWVRPPPPSLGQIPNLYRKFVSGASLIRFYICEHTYAISMLTLPFPSCCSSCPTSLSPSGPASRVLLCCSHPQRPGSNNEVNTQESDGDVDKICKQRR